MARSNSAPSGRDRRRKKWVPGGLQVRIAVSAFCVGAIVLMFYLQSGLLGLWWIYQHPEKSIAGVLQQTKVMLVVQFLVVALVTSVFAFWAGRSFFHFAGPIYRFRQHFLGMISGRWDAPCRLRSQDQLKDLMESINEVHRLMGERLQSQQEILSETRQLLQNATFDSGGAKAGELLARIAAQAEEHAERYPDAAASAEKEPAVEVGAQ